MTTLGADNLKILFLGATGYIGGSVLDRLLVHPDRAHFDLTLLLRSRDKARTFEEQFGLKTIIGSLDDTQLLEDTAADADVVINTADSDNLGAAHAILRGLKRKHAASGKLPIFIQTSGTGALVDESVGTFADHKIYNDTIIEDVKAIPKDAVHRNVDLALVEADSAGYMRAYIVVPSMIYGIADGALFRAGICNRHSVQLPSIVRASLLSSHAGTIGPGTNVWPNVHIADTADGFIVLLDALRADPERPGHGWEGFYFLENGHHSMHEAAEAIGQALLEAGKAKHATPTQFTPEELETFLPSHKYFVDRNARCRGDRARGLGWKPVYTPKDLLASMQPELQAILSSSV